MTLKEMEILATIKETQTKVSQEYEDHPMEQGVKECTMLSKK